MLTKDDFKVISLQSDPYVLWQAKDHCIFKNEDGTYQAGALSPKCCVGLSSFDEALAMINKFESEVQEMYKKFSEKSEDDQAWDCIVYAELLRLIHRNSDPKFYSA